MSRAVLRRLTACAPFRRECEQAPVCVERRYFASNNDRLPCDLTSRELNVEKGRKPRGQPVRSPPLASLPLTWYHSWYSDKMWTAKEAGRMNEVFSLLERMFAHGIAPNIHHFHLAIGAACKSACADRTTKALDYFARMVSDGIKPYQLTFSILFDCLAKCSDSELPLAKATVLRAELKAHGVDPGSSYYCSLIKLYGTHGALDEALGVVDEASKRGFPPDVSTFNLLLVAFGRARRIREVFDLYDKMLKYHDWYNVCSFRHSVTHTALFDACANASEKDRAFALAKIAILRADLEKIRGGRLRFGEYDVLVKAYVNHDEMHAAFALVDQMIAVELMPDEQIFAVLAAAIRRRCNLDDAMRIVALMEKSSVKLNRAIAATLVSCCEKTTDEEELRKIGKLREWLDRERCRMRETKKTLPTILNEITARETSNRSLTDADSSDYARELREFEEAFRESLEQPQVPSRLDRRRRKQRERPSLLTNLAPSEKV